MNSVKILRIVAVAVAVIGAFVAIPEAALVAAILGLVLGVMSVGADERTGFLVLAVALSAVSGALGAIPVVGGYVSDIMGNLSNIINAAALTVIAMWVKDQLTAE